MRTELKSVHLYRFRVCGSQGNLSRYLFFCWMAVVLAKTMSSFAGTLLSVPRNCSAQDEGRGSGRFNGCAHPHIFTYNMHTVYWPCSVCAGLYYILHGILWSHTSKVTGRWSLCIDQLMQEPWALAWPICNSYQISKANLKLHIQRTAILATWSIAVSLSLSWTVRKVSFPHRELALLHSSLCFEVHLPLEPTAWNNISLFNLFDCPNTNFNGLQTVRNVRIVSLIKPELPGLGLHTIYYAQLWFCSRLSC